MGISIVDKIKEESKKAGQSKNAFLYVKDGEKRRIRFLNDFDEGMEIVFHDSYADKINVPCQDIHYGRDCKYCDMPGIRTRSLFAWSVWDYESNEVKILMQAVNNCTAVPALMAFYEDYGTLLDRDIVLKRVGNGQNTTYTVMPQDKNKFKNTKARALSENAILKLLAKAYPDDDAEDQDEDEEEERPRKKKGMAKNAMNKPKGKKQDDRWDEDEEESETPDYSEMSARELYDLCQDREIDVLPKKAPKYYIKKLEEYDEMSEEWGDGEEEDDEWEEE